MGQSQFFLCLVFQQPFENMKLSLYNCITMEFDIVYQHHKSFKHEGFIVLREGCNHFPIKVEAYYFHHFMAEIVQYGRAHFTSPHGRQEYKATL